MAWGVTLEQPLVILLHVSGACHYLDSQGGQPLRPSLSVVGNTLAPSPRRWEGAGGGHRFVTFCNREGGCGFGG